MLSSCECCCNLGGVWMSWITFILATPPAEEETRGLTKNAKEAANRQQKWWNCTLDLILEGLETLSVSKSKMENGWNEHMIKFEWVESLLAPRAAREAGWKNKSEQIAPEISSQCSSDHFSSQFPRVFSHRIFIPQMHRCSQYKIFYLLNEVKEWTISNLISNGILY